MTVILINGSFGIGKSTVAWLLRQAIAGSAIYNPEMAGYVLRRLPQWVPLTERDTGDYQDMPLWRATTIAGVRAVRFMRHTVIVPMTFTNSAYLSEIRAGISRFDPDTLHFCLLAPLEVVEERLRGRGADPFKNAWQFRRAAECCTLHHRPEFAEHVSAAACSAENVAEHLRRRLNSN